MSLDAGISIQLAGTALYCQPVIEQGFDIDLPAQPDITIIVGETRTRDISRGYGYLYNRYAAEDPRELAPEGWRVAGLWDAEKAFFAQFDYYRLHFGMYDLTQEEYISQYPHSGKFKSHLTLPAEHPRWDAPNNSGYGGLPQNETGFRALPGGLRTPAGNFHYLGQAAVFWAMHKEHFGEDSPFNVAWALWNILGSSYYTWRDTDFGQAGAWNAGMSVRLVLDDMSLYHDGMRVRDIDGNWYDTIRITNENGYFPYDEVWTVQNLATTRFRNGDLIPNVTENAAWQSTDQPALCAYNNDMLLATREEAQSIPGAVMYSRYEENLLVIGNHILKERDMNHLLAERRLV